MTMRFFDRPTVKQLGITGFVFLVGLALGNGYRTTDAMAGQAAWLHEQCGQTIKSKVQATVRAHLKEDRDTFGFAPEDIKH